MITVEQKAELIRAALHARGAAYAPYSHYTVGAALFTSGGQIFTGANIENAAYPATICAERVAVFKAVSEGHTDLAAIAVVTRNGGMPCGSCRQVLAEFGQQTLVIVADETGKILLETSLGDLLPYAFGPRDLA